MPKLTETQKTANKTAAQLRTKAFSLRRKAFEAAMDRTAEALEKTAIKAATDAADSKFEAAVAAAAADRNELYAQIAAIQAEIARLSVKHRIEALGDERRAANIAYQALLKSEETKVKVDFPDVFGCYSAAEWEKRVIDLAASQPRHYNTASPESNPLLQGNPDEIAAIVAKLIPG